MDNNIKKKTIKMNINLKLNKMSKNVLKSKRFVVRKSLIGKNQLITFVTKNGDNVTYNHDKVYEIMKKDLENLPCYQKYKSYTATNNIPLVLRDKSLV